MSRTPANIVDEKQRDAAAAPQFVAELVGWRGEVREAAIREQNEPRPRARELQIAFFASVKLKNIKLGIFRRRSSYFAFPIRSQANDEAKKRKLRAALGNKFIRSAAAVLIVVEREQLFVQKCHKK